MTASSLSATASTTAPSNKAGVVEFLGFSRIDGYPMFRAFRQFNATGMYNSSANLAWAAFDATKNTFDSTTSMTSQITSIIGVSLSSPKIDLISALEDQLPGFVSNWTSGSGAATGTYPMARQEDDNTYAGVIGPKISSKSIAVGTIEVSSALRRSEIEDIKANTGMDIVQKMESILVNELSQTISKQIVAKIFEMRFE
jgi:hypothetical protein